MVLRVSYLAESRTPPEYILSWLEASLLFKAASWLLHDLRGHLYIMVRVPYGGPSGTIGKTPTISAGGLSGGIGIV